MNMPLKLTGLNTNEIEMIGESEGVIVMLMG